ncbi:MAG: ParM/StbA family protein [Cyanobacteria bacterium J06576_12]
MADLFLVVDTGGSQTKIIYQTADDDSPQFLLMPPEVEAISQKQFDRYQERIGWLGAPSSQQQAWFTLNEQLWVVGAFAAEFDPEDRLLEKKYENALYKVLAAVGVIAQKLSLSRRKLSIHLAIVLPWQEFSDRNAFEQQLRSLFAGFAFRGQKLKCTLKTFLCRPEGGGLAATRMRQKGLAWFQARRLVVLLFGHRNVSALFFENGQFKRGDSPLLGFSQMVDLIVDEASVLDRQALLLAMVKAMRKEKGEHQSRNAVFDSYSLNAGNLIDYPGWRRCDAIQALVSVRDEALQTAELDAIETAIETAIDEYWERIASWLNRAVPDDIDEVVVSGGAALMLEPKLVRYFSDSSRHGRSFQGDLVWDAELKDTMEKVFRWQYSGGDYIARFADAYGLFDQMLDSVGAKA